MPKEKQYGSYVIVWEHQAELVEDYSDCTSFNTQEEAIEYGKKHANRNVLFVAKLVNKIIPVKPVVESTIEELN